MKTGEKLYQIGQRRGISRRKSPTMINTHCSGKRGLNLLLWAFSPLGSVYGRPKAALDINIFNVMVRQRPYR